MEGNRLKIFWDIKLTNLKKKMISTKTRLSFYSLFNLLSRQKILTYRSAIPRPYKHPLIHYLVHFVLFFLRLGCSDFLLLPRWSPVQMFNMLLVAALHVSVCIAMSMSAYTFFLHLGKLLKLATDYFWAENKKLIITCKIIQTSKGLQAV